MKIIQTISFVFEFGQHSKMLSRIINYDLFYHKSLHITRNHNAFLCVYCVFILTSKIIASIFTQKESVYLCTEIY